MPTPGAERLDADDEHVAMAEAEEVLGGRARAALVVDLDRRLVGQGARVDHHQRQAGGAELLDLGVVARTGRSRPTPSTVARPIARASEPWSGRDEVERVALLLGRQRDALRERPEERVGEDDRQRLGREHADGVRRALGRASGRPGGAGSRASRRRSRIRLAVSGASRSGLLNANDTAVFETPASRATSAMRGRRRVRSSTVYLGCGARARGRRRRDPAPGDRPVVATTWASRRAFVKPV